jgi:hypothetical protein
MAPEAGNFVLYTVVKTENPKTAVSTYAGGYTPNRSENRYYTTVLELVTDG